MNRTNKFFAPDCIAGVEVTEAGSGGNSKDVFGGKKFSASKDETSQHEFLIIYCDLSR
jgi:hypothetical protein